MSIILETQAMLDAHRDQWVPRWCEFIDLLTGVQEVIGDARGELNRWKPLHFYMSVHDAKSYKTKWDLSVRHQGTEVAKLMIAPEQKPILKFEATSDAALSVFGFKASVEQCKWTDPEATLFRNHFKTLSQPLNEGKESALESLMLDELENGKDNKFLGSFRDIQPVFLYEDLRFQMVVPLSGNTGRPEFKTKGVGRIDILSRAGLGAGNKLALFELKTGEASAYKNAVAQSLIYSVCLLNILRDEEMGPKWWRLFGYKRELPKQPKMIAAVAAPMAQLSKYHAELESLGLHPGENIQLAEGEIQCRHLFFDVVHGGGVGGDVAGDVPRMKVVEHNF